MGGGTTLFNSFRSAKFYMVRLKDLVALHLLHVSLLRYKVSPYELFAAKET
jgi:hypothetical protein